MQKSNKKESNNKKNYSKIEQVAEILALLEEAQKTKDWIFQEIKRKHQKTIIMIQIKLPRLLKLFHY